MKIWILPFSICLLLLSGCVNAGAAAQTHRERARAEAAMLEFYALLHEGRYDEAASLYGGSYEILRGYNPDLDPEDRSGLLRSACTLNGFYCAPVRRVLEAVPRADGAFEFTVEFEGEDGPFTLRACCDSSAEDLTGETQFQVGVLPSGGGEYRIESLPIYVP
jgi:hypothetical protein